MDWQLSIPGKLVYWLIYQVPVSYWRLMTNAPKALMEASGLKVHGRYLFVPMFHDTTWVGRGLSVFFRLAILFSGTVLWLMVTTLIWVWLPLWFLLPLLGWVHDPAWLWLWLVSVGMVVIWRFSKLNSPWGKLGEVYYEKDVLRALPENLSQLVAGYPNNLDRWWNDGQVNLWLKRMGLGVNLVKQQMERFDEPVSGRDRLLESIYKISKIVKEASNKPLHQKS